MIRRLGSKIQLLYNKGRQTLIYLLKINDQISKANLRELHQYIRNSANHQIITQTELVRAI